MEYLQQFKKLIKPAFEKRYREIAPDYDKFVEVSSTYLRKSIRINTLKNPLNDTQKRLEKQWKLEQVPWCKEGFWVKHAERRDIGNTYEHALGYIYVQESASMIPPVVLNPKENEFILD